MSTTIDYKAEFEKRKAREKRAYLRRAIKIDLVMKKAEKAGIVVTEKEVDEVFKVKHPELVKK